MERGAKGFKGYPGNYGERGMRGDKGDKGFMVRRPFSNYLLPKLYNVFGRFRSCVLDYLFIYLFNLKGG